MFILQVVTVSVVEKEKVKTKPKEKGATDEVSEEVDEVEDEEEEEEEEEKEEINAVDEITEMIGEAKMYEFNNCFEQPRSFVWYRRF